MLRRLTFGVILLFLLVTLGVVTQSEAAAAPESAPQELFFLNWGEYIDPDVVREFEARFNAKVHEVKYDSDDTRTEILLSTEGKNFDVAVIDGASMQAYIRQSWLVPVSEKEVPNLKHVMSKWHRAYPGAETYAVPYFWGTLGIAYRSDLVKLPITSWMQLFKPSEELQGKIYMLPQSRELIDIALKALGHSVNTTGPAAYQQARDLLLAQKPYVKKYDVPSVTERSALVKGEVVAAMTYSGDALTLQEVKEEITFVNPREGGVLWVDYLVVLAKGTQKKLAMDFVNFLNEPKIAAQQAEYMYYATPNSAAEKLLPKEFLNDPTIYPPTEVLEKFEIEKNLPPRIYKKRNSIYSEVTQGKI